MEIQGYSNYLQQRVHDLASQNKVEKQEKSGDSRGTEAKGTNDTVSISTEARIARLKALLGVEGKDGRITKSDLEGSIDEGRKAIKGLMQEMIDLFGLKKGTEFSVSVDNKGKLKVNGDFEGKKEFEKALNNVPGLVDMFNKLSTKDQVMNLQNVVMSRSRTSLIDYISGGGESIDKFINDYEATKSMDPTSALLYYSSKYSPAFDMEFSVGGSEKS